MVRRRDLVATLGSGADLALRQGIQFLVLLVLARMLGPAQFGIVALLALFLSFASVIADLGLTTSLLRSKTLSPVDVSTAFWASGGAGLILTVAAIALARPVADALGVPRLAGLAMVMSLSILFTALGCVPSALLAKRLQFGRLLIVGMVGTALSGLVAIAAAATGHGVWALALQSLIMSAVTALGAWVGVPDRPAWSWDGQSARSLLGMGRYVLAANICDVGYSRGQTLLIGTVFGPAPLGYYMRADSTQQLPADAAAAVVSRVALPVFTEASESVVALRTGLRTSIRTAMTINAPAMALLGGLARPAVHTLFGPQWDASAPMLTILCLSGLMWPLHVMNINLLYAVGHARQVFRIDLVKKSVGLAAIVLGMTGGLMGVASAQVFVGAFAVLINGRAICGAIGLRTRDQLRSVASVTLIALAVGFGALIASELWAAPPIIQLVTLGCGGIVTYILIAKAVGASAVSETLALVRLPERTP